MKRAGGDKGACDRVFSQLVRMRGSCIRCGSVRDLQCAHVLSRRYSATRCDTRNAWCLCAGCHFLVDSHADEKMDLVEKTIGRAVYDELKAAALGNLRPWDWKAERARLEQLRVQMGGQEWKP